MDKNKNRTDLLAAGRKKLQQYRQKKETKGKTSSKGSKSEPEGDADQASQTCKSSAPLKASEGETISLSTSAEVTPNDSLAAHSIGSALPPDADSSTSGPADKDETFPSHDVELVSVNSGIGETRTTDAERGFDSMSAVFSGVSEGESIQILEPEQVQVCSAGTSDVNALVGGEGVDTPQKLFAAQDRVNQEAECSGSNQSDGSGKEGHGSLQDYKELETVASQDRGSDENLTGASHDIEGAQEVTHRTVGTSDVDDASVRDLVNQKAEEDHDVVTVSDSAGATCKAEEIPDTIPGKGVEDAIHIETVSELDGVPGCRNQKGEGADQIGGISVSAKSLHEEEDCMNFGEGMNKATHVTEVVNEVDVLSIHAEVKHEIDRTDEIGGLSASTDAYKTDETQDRNLEDHLGHHLEIAEANLSHEVNLFDFAAEQRQMVQTNFEQDVIVDDEYKQKHLHDETMKFVNKSQYMIPEQKSEGHTISFPTDRAPFDLYQLADVIRVLEEEEVEFLLRSRASRSKAEAVDVGLLENELTDALEIFKQQLYVANVAKDFFNLQLSEQLNLQMEFDQREHQLLNEVSNVSSLLKETQDNNTSLSKELVQCRSELQLMAAGREEFETQLLGSRREIEELTTKPSDLQNKLESSHSELTNILAELADCKALLTALETDNANLNESLIVVTDERKKLEEEKEYFIHENKKLSAQILECQEHLVVEHGKHAQLEAELREAIVDLEQLTKESIFLSVSADVHKSSLKELENRHLQLVAQVGEAKSHIEDADVPSTVSKGLNNDECSQKSSERFNGEVVPTMAGSLAFSLGEASLQQLEKECLDDSIRSLILGTHFEEAEKIIQKLEKEIEGMHSHSMSLSRSGGKVAGAGISKLIQAFESKVQHDDHGPEEPPFTEGGQSSKDSFELAKEQMSILRTVLRDLYLNVQKFTDLFREEHDHRKQATTDIRELEPLYEASKKQISHLEARCTELVGKLSEYSSIIDDLDGQSCKIQQCSDEMAALLQIQVDNLQKEVADKIASLEQDWNSAISEYSSRIDDLDSQSCKIQQCSNEMAAVLQIQVDNLQKEVGDKTESLEQDWNSAISVISESVGKLDASIGGLLTSTSCIVPYDSLSIGCHITALVNAANEVIGDLRNKLEAVYRGEETILSSYESLSMKFFDLHVRNELAVGLLGAIYSNLGKLLSLSCEDVNGHGMDLRDDRLHNLLQPSHYFDLMEQLGKLVMERLQIQSANNELESELSNKTQEIEKLSKKSLDASVIVDLLATVASAVEMDDIGIDSSKPPVPLLESLVAFLVQQYREAREDISFSREEFESKVMELNELKGKLNQLSSLSSQQEDEIHALKECLRKLEVDLEAAHSELRTKGIELEQSEQRVSSVREKLSIAVAKGKGLIVQRDNLKQSLSQMSAELERCSHELQFKDTRLCEVETKLTAYSEAGERIEALESELSYIRNSATALRESFLLKDSVLQRIEEILEDLELPEHFHSRDIIEKIEWLARSISGNSLPMTDWDRKSSVGGGSYSDTGFVVMDGWKDEVQPNSISGSDDWRRRYEDLQTKFYGLAEQNEMLEQSLMERNNLVQRWEEVLDRVDMPVQLQSMEPEERIQWLGNALSEAHDAKESLSHKIENFESYCESLTEDLEASQRKMSNLEAALLDVTHEKENLSKNLENLSHENDELLQKAIQHELEKETLRNEVTTLQEKLVEKLDFNDHNHVVQTDFKRLQVLVGDALQDQNMGNGASDISDIEHFEGLLKKLIENYKAFAFKRPELDDMIKQHEIEESALQHTELRSEDVVKSNELELVALKAELNEALINLTHVKEERDKILEKHQSLAVNFEELVRQRDDVLEKLNQEEQKLASTREKLNVAVRKGKGLVQQRDSMKVTIEEMNKEMERVKSEFNRREDNLIQYEMKLKDLLTYQEKAEALELDITSLANSLAEREQSLQASEETLSRLLHTLNNINFDGGLDVLDPISKMECLGKTCHDLKNAITSSEHESIKAKRAMELLLTELNEVQERADGLQEELSKVEATLTVLTTERDIAEAARIEALSHLEKFAAVCSEERKKELMEFNKLKSGVDQLSKGCHGFVNLLNDVFHMDLELLRNVETGMEHLLKQIDYTNAVELSLLNVPSVMFPSNSANEVKGVAGTPLDVKRQEHANDNSITEGLGGVNHSLLECTMEIDALTEKCYKHSVSSSQQAKSISKVIENVHRKIASHKESLESMNRDISHLKLMRNEKDGEVLVMRRNIALLYDYCCRSILEVENPKAQLIANGLAPGGRVLEKTELSSKLSERSHWQKVVDGEPSISEEAIRTMADNLLSAVKEFVSIQAEIVDRGQSQLKASILDLQKELQEKDIQQNRICAELVSQIKEAECIAKSHLMDLESAKAQVENLEKRIEDMEKERNMLELKIKELQDGEASSIELQERIVSLTDMLTAKEQEIEALMQALDEEESQMEGLTNRIGELENVLQQKNLALENLEASRGKAMAKLSTTVTKFDELHQLSESLLSEVENLQAQLQGRDAEISFLRQEVTRCTNDALAASHESNKSNSTMVDDLLTWLGMMISHIGGSDEHFDDNERGRMQAYKDIFEKKITSVMSELADLRVMTQSKDALLQTGRSRIEELLLKGETLENSLREKDMQLALVQGGRDPGESTSMTSSEIVEVEPMISKRTVAGASITPHVRSMRKVNSDQVAIGIDMDPGGSTLDDEDDDKVHGFKSLTTSKVIPKFTRPVSDMIDGLWVSCDRALMRQPALRLSIIMYWVMLHMLLATSMF